VDSKVGRAQASMTALTRAALSSLALATVVLCASSSGAASRSVMKGQDRLSCAWRIVAMSPWHRRETALFGLAASSRHDLWAVGYRSSGKHFLHRALIERWNGRRWASVPSPRIAGPGNELKSVASASSTDVWAVGHRDVPSGRRSRTLIELWDGKRWKIVSSPNVTTGRNDLEAVAVIDSKDVWAVGGSIGALTGDWQALMLHWDGSEWRAAPANFFGELLTASRAADRTVWAGGWDQDEAVVVHEVAGRWSAAFATHAGDHLKAIAAIGSTEVWGVGDTGGQHPFAVHWDGRQWRSLSVAAPVSSNLRAIAGSGPKDVWAFGSSGINVGYIEHWNGSRWQLKLAPSGIGDLEAAVALSPQNAWVITDGFIKGPRSLHYSCGH
jgi:hypothetical protein